MTLSNGALARLERAERDIIELKEQKANKEDVNNIRDDVHEVKKLLMWFMGVASASLISGFGIVIGILVG